jgi:hypothetical protein
MKKILTACFLVLFASFGLSAQGELNATVRIVTPRLQKYDRQLFDQLEGILRDFLNNTKWTSDVYEPEERIKCNFIMTIMTEGDNNSFTAELAVQSTRPVYGSGYDTPLLSHLDKDIAFVYELGRPIEFQREAPDNQNLPAILAFYAYTIIGLDYDSYSLYGGDAHLSAAQQLATNMQNSNNAGSGWKPGDGGKNRNRYWIIENLLNPRVKPYRAAMYNYYRKGLDVMSGDLNAGKTNILQALEEIDKVNFAYFNSMIIQMFANAKRDEVTEMWKVGPKPQRDRVMQIMTKLDPSNSQRYKDIGY